MAIYRVSKYCAFGPQDVKMIVTAYEDTLSALDLAAGDSLAMEVVAKKIIEIARARLLGQVEKRILYKGSFPLIYGLTRQGAWLLRKHGYDLPGRLLYQTDKQRRAGWRFIEHRVDITEFMIRLELACRNRSDIALIDRREIFDRAPKTQRDRRVRLVVKVRIDGAHQLLSVDPDELFGLRNVGTGKESFFMLERDRGEMPVHRRKSKDQTYYAKKMLAYHEANRVGEHVEELGLPSFRVLTVTTSLSRVQQMIEAQKEMTDGRGSNLFLFIEDARLLESNPLSALWTTGKGKSICIGA
jgi:hypothetical protein